MPLPELGGKDPLPSNQSVDELRSLATEAITDLWVYAGAQQNEIERLQRHEETYKNAIQSAGGEIQRLRALLKAACDNQGSHAGS